MLRYMKLSISGVVLMGCFFLSVAQEPFFVNKIEVIPGEKLMLHPRLPYIEGVADDQYVFRLDLPKGVGLCSESVVCTDRSSRIDADEESVKETNNGLSLSYFPSFSNLGDGMELHLGYLDAAGKCGRYVPVMKFRGTFDWKTFERKIIVPEGIYGAIPLLLKWADNPTYCGTLYFKSFKIKDEETGKVIFECRPPKPIVMKLEEKKKACCRLTENPDRIGNESGDRVGLVPGSKYSIACEVKGDGIKTRVESPADILKRRPFFTRTFICNVEKAISLPASVKWTVEDRNGKVYRSGELLLVAAGKVVKPKVIDTSVWICETDLHTESLTVQQLYMEKFDRWGLNTVEPQIDEPDYGMQLTEKLFSNFICSEANNLGMRIRNRLYFYYSDGAEYLKSYPEAASIDASGKRARPGICMTHILDGGKYDIPQTQVKGGKENPWMNYYYNVIKEAVRINKLDGIFWDFEINAAPYIKSLPKKDGSRRAGYTCICERCRRAFKEYAALDHVPSVDECCNDLYDRWVDFRCSQNIRFWQICAEAAREGKPGVTYGIYSGSPGAYCREGYGVDWTMAAQVLDFAMQRYPAPISLKTADFFRSAILKGVPEGKAAPKMLFQLQVFLYGDQWMFGMDANKHYAELSNIKNDVIKTVAVCGSYGWSFNGIWGMDDQFTLPVREANAILAKYEDYFVKGAKADTVKVKTGEADIATWRLDGKNITFVFNDTPQKKVLTIVNGEKEAEVKIAPYDTTVYEW